MPVCIPVVQTPQGTSARLVFGCGYPIDVKLLIRHPDPAIPPFAGAPVDSREPGRLLLSIKTPRIEVKNRRPPKTSSVCRTQYRACHLGVGASRPGIDSCRWLG